jgi:hypothetical protein
VAGDAAAAYNSSAVDRRVCERFLRQVVILPPGLFILYDVCRPSDPEAKAEFLCFFGDRPAHVRNRVYAASFGADPVKDPPSPIVVSESDWGGRAYMQFLLPRDIEEETYYTRILRRSAQGTGEQRFLAVCYVPTGTPAEHPTATLVSEEDACGVEGTWGDRTYRVTFDLQQPPGGRLEIRHRGGRMTEARLSPLPNGG